MKCWHAMKVERLAGEEVCLIKLQGLVKENVRVDLQSVSRLYHVV